MRSTLHCVVLLSVVVSLNQVPADARAQHAEQRLHLFTTPALIETSRSVRLCLHRPVPREVVFRFDAPWEGRESGYVTILRDGRELRMYYRGGGETTEEVTCLATSTDGVHWTRPTLGLIEFNGSKENNIVYRGRKKSYWESHNFTPFIDTKPSAPAAWRYKAVGLGRHVKPDGDSVVALAALVSPDGVHWSRLREKPIITKGRFDSQNVAFWDTARGCYACYLRKGRNGIRSVMVSTSTDFVRWSEPVWLDFGAAPPEHLYTNAIQPYFREPRIYIGFPMRFVPDRKQVGYPPRKTDGLSDGVFISSFDGVHFDRTFMEAFIRGGPDPNNWGSAHGNNTPAWGVVPVSREEMAIYWTEHYLTTPRLRRGMLRTDGFVSVNAPYRGGEFVTIPIVCAGSKLVLNYATSAVGSVRVEVQKPDGTPITGMTLDDCREIYGDEIERLVKWQGSGNLASFVGRPVRLRFSMKDADLYSITFRN